MTKRTLLIILLPATLVLILLGTGIPQKLFPAVKAGNSSYTIADYNFYYYEAYSSFLTEHQDVFSELGLNTSRNLKSQHYDEDTTWAQYFRDETLADMQEYEILTQEANAAGFDASQEISDVSAKKAEELRSYCVENGVKNVQTYLTALYGSGITEESFYTQLDRRTLAETYRDEVVLPQLEPSESEVQDYRAENLSEQEASDYSTANVIISYFAAADDRVSGQPEQRQWDNAKIKAEAAQSKAEEAGGDAAAYTAIAAAYSELDSEEYSDGVYENLTQELLSDEALSDWIYDPLRSADDTTIVQGSSGYYLLYFSGWGESSLDLQARAELLEQRYQAWLTERKADCSVSTNPISMLIAR